MKTILSILITAVALTGCDNKGGEFVEELPVEKEPEPYYILDDWCCYRNDFIHVSLIDADSNSVKIDQSQIRFIECDANGEVLEESPYFAHEHYYN